MFQKYFIWIKNPANRNKAWDIKSLGIPHMLCYLLYRTPTTRCPHSTDRSASLLPERAQPPSRWELQVDGDAASLHFSSVVHWSVRRQTAPTAEKSTSLKRIRASRGCEQIQTPVASWSAFFHGNDSPEVFLRTVKVWSLRGRTQQAVSSNGERVNQPTRIRQVQ